MSDVVTLQRWIPAGKGREAGEGAGVMQGMGVLAGVVAAQMTTVDSSKPSPIAGHHVLS